MTDTPPSGCDKVLLVQAELDGELDAAEAATLAVHRAACPVCQAAAAELGRARALIREELYEPMPEDARRRVTNALAAAVPVESRRPAARRGFLGWWHSAAGFGLGAACAAAIALLLVAPGDRGLTDQVVAGHIRALQPGHLEDVASSDRHTVKPWFDGRLDFAPPVKDLAADRFPLTGGRLDYLGGRPVAALVYRRDKHIIDLFILPGEAGPASPESAQRHGYNVVQWRDGGMNFWAVSDVEASQLSEFVERFRRSP